MEKGKGPMPELKTVGIGTAVSMGAYLLLLTLTAYLTVSGRVGEEWTERAVWLCACLASLAGAWTASRGERGILPPLLTGGVFSLTVVLLGALFGEGVVPHRILSLLAASLAGALGAALLRPSGRGRRGKRRRAANVRR